MDKLLTHAYLMETAPQAAGAFGIP